MIHMPSLKAALRFRNIFKPILFKKYKLTSFLLNKKLKKYPRSYLEKKQGREILTLILIKQFLKIYQGSILKETFPNRITL